MLTIVDYGAGNLPSIRNMLKKIQVSAVITGDPHEISFAGKIILPGVGHFGHAMRELNKRGLIDILREKALTERVPFLGICLGAQMLLEGSEEAGEPGLGWIRGKCVRFQVEDKGLKVPHMGWNDIQITQPGGLFHAMGEEPRFYFAHTYHFVCSDANDVIATTNYGYDFPCAVRRGNIAGVQFHPEKSHRFGMTLLKNFAEGRL